MSRIKSKDTKIEKIVRSSLHALGFRFRIHRKDLPGKPDIYLPKYKVVIFVHGCFWHQHDGCKAGRIPETNREYWERKLYKNTERDKNNINLLNKMGIKVIVVWECEVKDIDNIIKRVIAEINR